MTNFLRVVLVASLVVCAACGGSTPAAPTPPPPPACQANGTADVTLTNSSVNNLTFDVFIDNISRGAIAPTRSLTVTVSAGIDHVIQSRVTNTTVVACTSTTSFASCSTQTLTCSR